MPLSTCSSLNRRQSLRALTLGALTLAGGVPLGHAQGVAPPGGNASGPPGAGAPRWLADLLPQARLQGKSRLRFWGLDIYDAHLWTRPDFEPERFAQHPLVLDLTYLRSLSGPRIAERSLKEMQALPAYDPVRADAWLQAMTAVFPDVADQDRLAGVYRPGQATRFWLNGRALGEVADPAFGPLFFGIWLSPRTSEPQMRQALLGLARTP